MLPVLEILTVAILLIFAAFIVWQVVWPCLTNKKVFWIFRSTPDKELVEVAEAKQEVEKKIQVVDAAEELEQKTDVLKRKRASRKKSKPPTSEPPTT